MVITTPLPMDGGTVFHFVTEGIEAALDRAREAAGGKDIRLGGGAATIRQYLTAGLIDEMHLAIAPRALGSGEALFAGIDMPKLGYELVGACGVRKRCTCCSARALGTDWEQALRSWAPTVALLGRDEKSKKLSAGRAAPGSSGLPSGRARGSPEDDR